MLFAIVVTYKGHLWYERCFSSLRASTIPISVVIVDNASNDGTINYIRNSYPEFHIIESPENLGFGKANNLGIRYALDQGCDYVFLLNQDAWIESDTMEKLVSIHQAHPEYGILSPIHLNAEKNAIEQSLVTYLDDWKTTDRALFNDMYFHRERAVYETKYVNAAAWLLPRKTLEIVGGFDPIFTHYGEDDNYLHRVLFHKMKIGVCPKALVVHDTVRRLPKGVQKASTENRSFLTYVTNVNNPLSINGLCFFLLRKTIGKYISLKIPQARDNWEAFRFLIRNRKGILRSRSQNIVAGPNWL